MRPTFYGLAACLCVLCFSALIISAQDFKDAKEALNALNTMGECKCVADVRAFKYFVGHKEESIPILINFTEFNPQRYFVGIRALSKLKDERVSYFLIDLLHRYLHNVGCPDGEACYTSGLDSELIRTLGDYGDQRAIQLIREALTGLNVADREMKEEALCKLGDISIDKLFELKSKSLSEMLKFASHNQSENPEFSIKAFDWIIEKFPGDSEVLFQAHIGKVQVFINREDYESVIRECEFLKATYSDRTKDLWFSVERHLGRRLDELVVYAQGKIGNPTQ